MKTVEGTVKNKGKEYGPYNFIEFESLTDAAEFYGSEKDALDYLNRGSRVGQQAIARTLAELGKPTGEINEALAKHKPKVAGAGGKKSGKNKQNQRFVEMLKNAASANPKVAAKAGDLLHKEGIEAAIAYMEKEGITA